MKVKVCGITNREDALLCEKYGADALGFIFYKESKRYIEPENAADIIRSLSPFIMKIGVFVNESEEEINKISSAAGLNAVQLHNDDDTVSVSKINIPVIKAYRIKDSFNFTLLSNSSIKYFLLDAYSDNFYGGTGKQFDWNIIPEDLKYKIILAGGVSIDNLEYIFNYVKPAAIDLSSSLETEPGKKDAAKVTEFFRKFELLNEKGKEV